MRISRSTLLLGVLAVLIILSAAWHLANRPPGSVAPIKRPPSAPTTPKPADETLAEILEQGTARPDQIHALLAADRSLARPDEKALEKQFRRMLASPPIINVGYDIPDRDYVPKGEYAWLQPLASGKVTESEDAIRWFEWLDDDTLVYSTANGIYRKDLDGPPWALAERPMARMSVPTLSPDRKLLAAVVPGGILVVGTESGEEQFHAFERPINDITWSPDSRLAGFTTRTEFWTLDRVAMVSRRLHQAEYLRGEEWIETRSMKVVSTNDPQWSPDGRYVAVRQLVSGDPGSDYLSFTILNGQSGKVVRRVNCWYRTCMSWSPDSRTIAYGDSGGDADGVALAVDIVTERERLNFCGGTDTVYGRSAWSPDGKYVAMEFLGRGWEGIAYTYRTLGVFEPVGTSARPRPAASRPLPMAWHPTKHLTANVVEAKLAGQDYRVHPERLPTVGWTLRLISYAARPSSNLPYTGKIPDRFEYVALPPLAGRKQTPRWSPDGTKLAVLCDISGKYQVHVTEPVSQSRSRENADTWLASAREHLSSGNLSGAVPCLQNAARLGAPSAARVLLADAYLRLADKENRLVQRSRLLDGALFEAARVPFGSLDASIRKRIMQAVVTRDSLSRAYYRVAQGSER
ncbi:MAG: PD40 domain-containing protein [Armatimonadetes bacterium]|nr:PD40 domain-containing protein [Armatimonadota bacterium]